MIRKHHNCLSHTTGYNTTTQTFKELNIGCEACHWPGSKHVKSCGYCHIRATQADGGIYNFPVGYMLGKSGTLRYNPEPYTNNVSFFPDKTTKRHHEQYLDVKTSKHYTSEITCTSCHSPHDAGNITVYPVSGLPSEFVDRSIAIFNGDKITSYSAWNGAGLRMPKESLCKSCHRNISCQIHAHTGAIKIKVQIR